MGPARAISFTDVAGSNPAACPRVSGPGWKLQVGNFESIEEWFLVTVELVGVLNRIQQLRRTSHIGHVAYLVFRPSQVLGPAVAGGHRRLPCSLWLDDVARVVVCSGVAPADAAVDVVSAVLGRAAVVNMSDYGRLSGPRFAQLDDDYQM